MGTARLKLVRRLGTPLPGLTRKAVRENAVGPGQYGPSRRLDSVVFRLGFAPTILAARQLVAHGHVRVDGARVDRPAYRVSGGEMVTLSARAGEIPDVVTAVERGPEIRLPGFLALDGALAGRVLGAPSRADVPFLVDETAIVEFYAR
jgi:small subunit ribosomal protein S4